MSALRLVDLNETLYLEWTVTPDLFRMKIRSGPFTFQNSRYHFEIGQNIFGSCLLLLMLEEGPGTEIIVVRALMVVPGSNKTECEILTREKVLKVSPEHTLAPAICTFLFPVILDVRTEFRFIFILEQDRTAFRNGKVDTPTQTECAEGTSDFPSDLDSLSLDFAELLKNKTLPDVKLKCGGRNDAIPAHRSVLAARSEVFAAMFRNEMAESRTGDVNVDDMDDKVTDLFLEYVYSGKIPSGVPDEVVPDLYAAADKYAVHSLRKTCREQMVHNLTEVNCVNFLTLADAHGDVDFKKSVIDYICSHEAVLNGEKWTKFTENPSKVVVEVYQSFVKRKTSGLRLDNKS